METKSLIPDEKELSTKRIPVSPSTWSALHNERQAGESYDTMLQRIIFEAGRYRLIRDIEEIENSGDPGGVISTFFT